MSSNPPQERVAVRVARKLVNEIRRRGLRPGSRLEAEHRMVADLGVSRATVREALRFLELQGALRIKAGPGGGPVVSVPGADHLASVLSLHLQFVDASFRSVVEARRSLYPVLTSMAAANAGRDDIVALQQSIAAMHGCVHEWERFRREIRHFFGLIAAASGNRVLALLVDALHRMSEGTVTTWDEKMRRSALRSYETMIAAIESKDGETARTIMESSLAAAARYWERAAPDELDQPVAWITADR